MHPRIEWRRLSFTRTDTNWAKPAVRENSRGHFVIGIAPCVPNFLAAHETSKIKVGLEFFFDCEVIGLLQTADELGSEFTPRAVEQDGVRVSQTKSRVFRIPFVTLFSEQHQFLPASKVFVTLLIMPLPLSVELAEK